MRDALKRERIRLREKKDNFDTRVLGETRPEAHNLSHMLGIFTSSGYWAKPYIKDSVIDYNRLLIIFNMKKRLLDITGKL